MEDFDIVVTQRALGVSLGALRCNSGAFVDSQYHSTEKIAAQSAEIRPGDRLLRIAVKDVSGASLAEIKSILTDGDRPVVLRFRRYTSNETTLSLFDHRWRCWLEHFLRENPTVARASADMIQVYRTTTTLIDYFATGCAGEEKHVCGLGLDCVMFCIQHFDSSLVSSALRDSVNELVSAHGTHNSERLLNALCAANAFLEAHIREQLLVPFSRSSWGARAVAWLSGSPAFYRATLSEVLQDRVLGVCYFLFLCQLRR
jgi:hypothetical protein